MRANLLFLLENCYTSRQIIDTIFSIFTAAIKNRKDKHKDKNIKFLILHTHDVLFLNSKY